MAIAAGAAILALAAIGALDLLAPSLPLSAFSLEGERTVTAVFSAALLLGAGVVAWQLGGGGGRNFGSVRLWRFMSAFLVFMALDELLAIHEHVSAPVTGTSWQVFYAPLVLSAAIAWLVILRRLPSGPVRWMWMGGAAAWFASQALEAVQWDGDRLLYAWMFVPEETLEMTGSLLWGLSLLLALRMVHEMPDDGGTGEPATTSETPAKASRQSHGRRRRRVREPDRTGQRSGPPASRTPNPR